MFWYSALPLESISIQYQCTIRMRFLELHMKLLWVIWLFKHCVSDIVRFHPTDRIFSKSPTTVTDSGSFSCVTVSFRFFSNLIFFTMQYR